MRHGSHGEIRRKLNGEESVHRSIADFLRARIVERELSAQWVFGPMSVRSNGFSAQWVFGPMGFRRNGFSALWVVTHVAGSECINDV